MDHKKKLLLFDIDGTLYDNAHDCVPLSTIEALRKLKDRHHLAIATGRARFMLHPVREVLPFIDYFILMNGQYIESKGKTIYDAPPSVSSLELLARDMLAHDDSYGMECLDYAMASKIDFRLTSSYKNLYLPMPLVDPFHYRKGTTYQMWAFVDEEEATRLASAHPSFQFLRWDTYAYDILTKGASKGRGARELARYLGLSRSDVYAFGDGTNDVEFLSEAGTSVCMGNGEPQCKAVASLVTATVSEDGLAKALYELKLL